MKSLDAAGGYGSLILVLTLVIVALGLACAAARARRMFAITVLLAGILPLGVGFLGVLSGGQERLELVESLRAPTEQDFEQGNDRADASLALGFGAMMLCDMVAFVALARASKPGLPS